jgi:adenylate kinase family enzyme
VPAADPEAARGACRILIYGVTGSGKSIAAGKIASRLRLPRYLVDELTWEPGWTPVAPEEQRHRLGEIAAQDSWVLDSAYSSWLDVVLTRAELIIGLDYPRWFSLQRLLRRTVARIVDKQPICNGNVETIRNALGRDAIVRWHFRSFSRKRNRLRTWQAAQDGPPVLLFQRSTALETWIASLRPEQQCHHA